MRDLSSRKLICVKGVLLLIAAGLASVALIMRHPEVQTGLLLAIAVWCFARFYYFLFYALERYVDPRLRYAGILALFTRRASDSGEEGSRQARER